MTATTAVAMHETVECKRINSSADFHVKSWSYRFTCPTCGKSRRYNTNFLGSRWTLSCNGKAIVRVAKIVVGSSRGACETTITARA